MEYPTYLIHYGTLGQKWGVRKYQNEDGTWTEEGLRRRRKLYDSDSNKLTKSGEKYFKKLKKEKDKTQDLYSKNSRRLISLQNSYIFEDEFQREYNDYLFKKLFNQTIKNIEYSKVIDSEMAAIGQKYLAEAKGLDKSIDNVFVKTDENGNKSIHFKVDEEKTINNKSDEEKRKEYVSEAISKIDADNIVKNTNQINKYIDFIESLNFDNYGFDEYRKLRAEVGSQSEKIMDSFMKNDLLESSEKIWWVKPEEEKEFFKQNKRISEATDLAMKAAGKEWIDKHVRYYNNDEDYYNKEDKPNKMSFLQASMNYPDENRSSGMVQIADLVNRGYSKKEIKNIIKLSGVFSFELDNNLPEKYNSHKTHDTLHAIGSYQNRDDFIDKCIELRGNQLSDSKQSRIKALVASGKSQEEVAKILGVSTSTVNKYK